jgi:hypothetical protein
MSVSDVVIVADAGDALAASVRSTVAGLGGSTAWYHPNDLASVEVRLTMDEFRVDRRPVRSVFWRVSPEMPLAGAFREDDRAFAAAETAAVWIAALRTRSVTAINRFDAAAWYSGLRPHYWRDRLSSAGIAVTSVRIGGDGIPENWLWIPYTTGGSAESPGQKAAALMAAAFHAPATYVTWPVVRGNVIRSAAYDSNIGRTARFLDMWGVGVAAIDADEEGRVHLVRVLPIFDDATTHARIASEIGRHLHGHCTDRRS